MENQNPEKKRALEAAMGQIEKQFGKGSVMKLGEFQAMNIEAIPTGALGLDIALGIGGVPRGRIVEIYGPESSGKTTLALHIIAEAQKTGGEAEKVGSDQAKAFRQTVADRSGTWEFHQAERIEKPIDERFGFRAFECG